MEVGVTAYCKMVLHAIKYPHCAIRGVLLGHRPPPKGGDSDAERPERPLRVVDAIPATHTALLAPPVETLFIHLDAYCREQQLQIVGLYFCNQLLANNSLDELWARIGADKIRDPVLLQIDNAKLSLNATSPCIRAFEPESAGKWRQVESCSVENSDDTVILASIAIQNKLHRMLADFENHLDELMAADFYNVELNKQLMSIT